MLEARSNIKGNINHELHHHSSAVRLLLLHTSTRDRISFTETEAQHPWKNTKTCIYHTKILPPGCHRVRARRFLRIFENSSKTPTHLLGYV